MKTAVRRMTRDFFRSREIANNYRQRGCCWSFDDRRPPSFLDGVDSSPLLTTTTKTISSSSTASQAQPHPQSDVVLNLPRKPVVFRTEKKDPATFDLADVGLFHSLSTDKFNQLFQFGPEERFKNQAKAIDEPAFMIRRPFLEIRDCIVGTEIGQPNRRYLLYGKRGAGKTMTLNSVVHFAVSRGWMIVQMPWPLQWLHLMAEGKTEISTWNPRRIDLPYISADWLRNFKVQNAVILATRFDLVTTKTYKWSAREETPAGSHFSDLIDFGLERIRYASDVIGSILREIRLFSTHIIKPPRTIVTMDGINMFWMQTTLSRSDQSPKVYVPAETVSVVHNFKKMLRSDWTGGTVVASVDADRLEEIWISNRMRQPYDKQCVNPREILGEEGFLAVEPFYPVHIPYYDKREYLSAMEFYIEKKIVQLDKVKSEQGIKEIEFLTNRNPGCLCDLSRIL